MASRSKIKGLDSVVKRLNSEIIKIEGRTLKGLIRGAVIIRRSMDKVSPKIPVDLNNLRLSYYLVTSEGKIQQGQSPSFKKENGKSSLTSSDYTKLVQGHTKAITNATNTKNPVNDGPYVVFGFSAYYAIYVHEMVGAVNWNRKGSGPKFLESAVDRNLLEVLYTVAKEAKVK